MADTVQHTEHPSGLPELTPFPVTAVTCLEDRAQVERTVEVRVEAGASKVRLGPITLLAVDRSLWAEVSRSGTGDGGGSTGAVVVDARIVRCYTPSPPNGPGEDAGELRRHHHELSELITTERRREQRLISRLDLVAQARAELLRDITEGSGAGRVDPVRWAEQLTRVGAEHTERAEELRGLQLRLRDLGEQRREAERVLLAAEEEVPQLTAYVEAVVESDGAGPVELTVSHLVPCALWRPAYRATLDPGGKSVRVETDAVVWQRTGENWDGVRLTLSTARPTLAASPPVLSEDVLSLRERSSEERKQVEVDLREEEISRLAEAGSGSGSGSAPGEDGAGRAVSLPGVDDGGEVRVLPAPAPASVVSDGLPHRVHLSEFTATARTERACAPELSPLVSLVAYFPNEAEHVLLAGPVDLVRGSGFTGRGELAFAGVGEEVRLPFGSEDTFRVVRHVEESRSEPERFGVTRSTVLTRTVRLFISRLDGPHAEADATAGTVPLVLRERIPVSEVSAVEVRLKRDACTPPPDEVDAEGIARYELRLGPGERQAITLVHETTASSKVVGL